MSKIIERIRRHPLVTDIRDERDYKRKPPGRQDEPNGDGFWVYLKRGYINAMDGVHCIHEDSPSECYAKLKCVEPCQPGCECDFDK